MTYKPSLAFTCPKCLRTVTLADPHALEQCDPHDGLHAIQHTIGECSSCETAVLLKNVATPEIGDNGYHRWWSDAEVLYPVRDEKLDPAIPPEIAASFQEAVRVRQAGAPTATAIMCRRTLEGVCSHFGAPGRTLFERLKSLKDANQIDERIYKAADLVLREFGNEAVHECSTVISAEDAKDALDFTKVVLHHAFVVEAAFVAFQGRRPAKS